MPMRAPTRPRLSHRMNFHDDGGPVLIEIPPPVPYVVSEIPDWCIYDCPARACRLTEQHGIQVLWGTCTHPIDLSDTPHEEHLARWKAAREAERREWLR